MKYIYFNIQNSPNLVTSDVNGDAISGIHYDVENSAMTDKSIEWCRWDEATQNLEISFINELSSNDKSILDSIVTNNI